MRNEDRGGVYGRDKREGVKKLHQAMNRAALVHGVYGQVVVRQMEGGEMSPQITIRLYQSICPALLIDLHLSLHSCSISQYKHSV